MHDIDAAIAEARYCLETLRFEGISLFASYGEKFLGDAAFDPLLHYLESRHAVVHVHPSLHPSSKSLDLPWPGFMIEYPFDTTRAAVNLLFSGALERFPNIRFILSHAGGTLPYLAWRLSVAPMIDKRLKQRTREEIFAGLKTFWYDNALASGAAPMGALSHIATPDRIVFGSDWPFCNDRVVAEEVADFTAPDFLDPQTVAMIARDNALKLFRTARSSSVKRPLRLVPADSAAASWRNTQPKEVEQRQDRRAGKGHREIGQAEVFAAAPGEREIQRAPRRRRCRNRGSIAATCWRCWSPSSSAAARCRHRSWPGWR